MKDVAVTCYVDDVKYAVDEFHWLYRSWLLSGSWQTSNVICFHNPKIDTARFPKCPGVFYVPLVPLSEREPEWKAYPFINSIWFVGTQEATCLANYEYVLRTDQDVFLTPNFPKARPRLAMFGRSLYCNGDGVTERLAEVAAGYGVRLTALNVGSTVLANFEYVKAYSALQQELTRRLLADAFPEDGGTWPGWYSGVASMYAGCMAASAVMGDNFTIGGLDCYPMAHGRIGQMDFHIHAYHTHEYFSKFAWRKGEYRNKDMNGLDVTYIPDYCLWCAGEGSCE